MAFLANLFGKKKKNQNDDDLTEVEEGLTEEEEAAAEAAEEALRNDNIPTEADVEEASETIEEEGEHLEKIEDEITLLEEQTAYLGEVCRGIMEGQTYLEEDPPAFFEEAAPADETGEKDSEVIEDAEPSLADSAPAEEEDTTTKKSFWGRLKSGLTKTRNAIFAPVDNLLKAFTKIDEDLFEELEEILITADVGMAATEEILDELRERVKDGRLKEKEQVMTALREIITDMIGETQPLKLETTPTVIMVIGVNGAGKTTSIGKISKRLRLRGKKVVVAAADTFRAAAIDQLAVWCERAQVEMVKQSEGSDPTAVVFDAIAAAKKKQADVLIIDTAGRLQNKKNLMNELAKMNRVIDRELPDACRENLLVLDATTGQNAVSQAKEFRNAADITGITLNKLDGTAKGGIVISIKRELGIPVKFIGVGEKIDDMQEFDAEDFVSALFGE